MLEAAKITKEKHLVDNRFHTLLRQTLQELLRPAKHSVEVTQQTMNRCDTRSATT